MRSGRLVRTRTRRAAPTEGAGKQRERTGWPRRGKVRVGRGGSEERAPSQPCRRASLSAAIGLSTWVAHEQRHRRPGGYARRGAGALRASVDHDAGVPLPGTRCPYGPAALTGKPRPRRRMRRAECRPTAFRSDRQDLGQVSPPGRNGGPRRQARLADRSRRSRGDRAARSSARSHARRHPPGFCPVTGRARPRSRTAAGREDSRLDYAGVVEVGFRPGERAAIVSTLDRSRSEVCPFARRPIPSRVEWVEPTLIVEVRSLASGTGRWLREPVFSRVVGVR
jgi:hypothetical protein